MGSPELEIFLRTSFCSYLFVHFPCLLCALPPCLPLIFEMGSLSLCCHFASIAGLKGSFLAKAWQAAMAADTVVYKAYAHCFLFYVLLLLLLLPSPPPPPLPFFLLSAFFSKV